MLNHSARPQFSHINGSMANANWTYQVTSPLGLPRSSARVRWAVQISRDFGHSVYFRHALLAKTGLRLPA